MTGYLSSSLRAVLQAEGAQPFFVWEIALPSGTRRMAVRDVAVAGLGMYDGVVISSAPIARQVSDRDNALQLSTSGITFDATDFNFQRELEGSGANSIRGSVVTVKLGAVGVATANYATVFGGLLSAYRRDGPLTWSMTFHSNDRPLRNTFPRTPLLQGDFPFVGDPAVYGAWLPIIYGIHDSRGSGDNGMVPCPYVDTLAFRYLVAHGWVTVDRVYVDGVLQGGGAYSILHSTINGRLFTLIKFGSDQGLTALITADVTGYEATGDGSGALVTGANVFAHMLTNFIYGDYQGGNWAATHAIVDSTFITGAQSFLTAMGWQKVSRRYGGDDQVTAINAVNEFCSSLQLYAFFTRAGQIAIAPMDHRTNLLSFDVPRWLRWDQDVKEGSFGLDYDDSGLLNRLALSFVLGSTDNSYRQNTEVRDSSATEDAAASLSLPWSYASLL